MTRQAIPFRRSVEGSAAVEFAIVLPLLVTLVLGGIGYGVAETTIHSVQQLAAEAARASIAGLSSAERASLARSFIANNVGSYAFLDPSKVSVAIRDGDPPEYAFSVAVTIDLSDSLIYQLGEMLPLPAPTITRTAVVRRGGFLQ